jgi:predicted N-formylglutamate amidohydrolase
MWFNDPMSVRALDEPPAYSIERPQGGSAYVLACDHASRRIPRSLGDLGLSEADRAAHIAWDIGAAAVAQRLSAALDATLVLQNYSRLVIDCNRPPTAPDSVPRQSGGIAVPGNARLDDAEAAARRRDFFDPYHAALGAILAARSAAGSTPVLVALHSFTPNYLGQQRPWHTGLLYHRDTRLAQCVLPLLRADANLIVGDNLPYAMSDLTDYTLPHHGEARAIPHVGIEIRQDLIQDAAGQAAWADRLATLLPAALQALTARR